MSDANDRPTEPITVKELFAQAVLLLPGIIRGVFHRCNYPANSEDVDRCWIRVMTLLWDEDEYKPLRTLREEAKLPAYLFSIAHREVIHFLIEQGRNVPLEDLSQEIIEQAPTQYETLLRGERLRKLDEAIEKKLTEHERNLLALMREGKKTAEIARELGLRRGRLPWKSINC